MIQYTGAKPVPIVQNEANQFSFTADQVLAQITPKTSLIILNSPGNPCGGAASKAEIAKLVKGLERHPNVAVMSDEIYSQMLYGGREHESFLRYPQIKDRLILLDGWSKTYAMTGWRLGFSVWPKALVEKVVRLAVNCHSCVNAPTQYAGIAALEGPQDEVHKMVAAFDERRRTIVPLLNQLPGRHLPGPRRRLLRVPQRHRHRHGRARAAEQDAGDRRASPPSPAPASASTARATSASPTPTPSITSARRSSASPRCCGIDTTCHPGFARQRNIRDRRAASA